MMYVKVFVECEVVYNVDFIGLCDLKEFLIDNIIYSFFLTRYVYYRILQIANFECCLISDFAIFLPSTVNTLDF